MEGTAVGLWGAQVVLQQVLLHERQLRVELVRLKDGLAPHCFVFHAVGSKTQMEMNPELSILRVQHKSPLGVFKFLLNNSIV